jgi:hypothetical protein
MIQKPNPKELSNLQSQLSKKGRSAHAFAFENWDLPGIWSLGFRISSFQRLNFNGQHGRKIADDRIPGIARIG